MEIHQTSGTVLSALHLDGGHVNIKEGMFYTTMLCVDPFTSS